MIRHTGVCTKSKQLYKLSQLQSSTINQRNTHTVQCQLSALSVIAGEKSINTANKWHKENLSQMTGYKQQMSHSILTQDSLCNGYMRPLHTVKQIS